MNFIGRKNTFFLKNMKVNVGWELAVLATTMIYHK